MEGSHGLLGLGVGMAWCGGFGFVGVVGGGWRGLRWKDGGLGMGILKGCGDPRVAIVLNL